MCWAAFKYCLIQTTGHTDKLSWCAGNLIASRWLRGSNIFKQSQVLIVLMFSFKVIYEYPKHKVSSYIVVHLLILVMLLMFCFKILKHRSPSWMYNIGCISNSNFRVSSVIILWQSRSDVQHAPHKLSDCLIMRCWYSIDVNEWWSQGTCSVQLTKPAPLLKIDHKKDNKSFKFFVYESLFLSQQNLIHFYIYIYVYVYI